MFSGLKCGHSVSGQSWCEECGGETPHQEVGAVLARCRALVTKVAGLEDAEKVWKISHFGGGHQL